MYYDEPTIYEAEVYYDTDFNLDFVMPDGRLKPCRIILPLQPVLAFYERLNSQNEHVGRGTIRAHLLMNLRFSPEEFDLPYSDFCRLAKAKALDFLQQ